MGAVGRWLSCWPRCRLETMPPARRSRVRRRVDFAWCADVRTLIAIGPRIGVPARGTAKLERMLRLQRAMAPVAVAFVVMRCSALRRRSGAPPGRHIGDSPYVVQGPLKAVVHHRLRSTLSRCLRQW